MAQRRTMGSRNGDVSVFSNRLMRRFTAALRLRSIGVAIAMLGLICHVAAASTGIPRLMAYQGKLLGQDGLPLDGNHTVILRLYDSPFGGDMLWREIHVVRLTANEGGGFSLILGQNSPFPNTLDFNTPLWLTTEVDERGERLPREQLPAVSHAFNADTIDGIDGAELLQVKDLSDGKTRDVADDSRSGTVGSVSRADHGHRGVRSIAIAGTDALSGNVSLAAGSNVHLVQDGRTIMISATDLGGGDITTVTAGAGLWGGGEEGDVTIAIVAAEGLVVGEDMIGVDVGTGPQQIVQLDEQARLPAVDGSQVTNLDAARLAGTVPDANLAPEISRLGPSIESGDVSDGTLTAQDTADNFLTSGVGVALSKTEGSWEISAVGAGGDITSVLAGDGLAGGGTSGRVTLGIAAGPGLIVSPDLLALDIGTRPGQIVQLDEIGALPPVNGYNLRQLNASALTDGTVPSERLSTEVSLLGQSIGSPELEDGAVIESALSPDSVGAAALQATAIKPGDIQPEDLPAHADAHQPGGEDALLTDSPVRVGESNAPGVSARLSRADHTHEGLHSIGVPGLDRIVGDVELVAGPNIVLSKRGNAIKITTKGDELSNRRVSSFTEDSIIISTNTDTTLSEVDVTKLYDSSAVLLLATVQLSHVIAPNVKTVAVRVFRDKTPLDGIYQAQIGKSGKATQSLPVHLHLVDTVGKGTYTYSLRARASGAGAQATVRRLTAIELL